MTVWKKRKYSISFKEPERLGFIVFSVSPVGHLGFVRYIRNNHKNEKPWKEHQFMLFGWDGKENIMQIWRNFIHFGTPIYVLEK